MAYTYDDFLTAAKTAGLLDRFSQHDLQTAQKNPEFGLSILSLKQNVANATTEEQKLLANEAANQLRRTYGNYTGGADGSGYEYAGSPGSQTNDPLGQINNYGSFVYDNQNSYQQLLDSIVNQQPFSYDLQADPSWGSYKKAYMREGDRANANALAQAAAASGGLASSYAMTAAQQAGNYYAGQLADIIPTLEENAYSRYLSDFNNRLNSLGAMEADRAFDYQNWMNEYSMLQDRLAQEQQAYENALMSYQTLGYATPEVAEILGISSGGNSGGSSSGYSSGGSGGGYDNGGLTYAQISELQNALGVTADGMYGANSRSAAGGLSAEEAYAKYITGVEAAHRESDLVNSMINALQGNAQPEEIDTSNFTVTNRNGNGWVAVDGSRMTWTELERKVNQGKIIEVIDPDKGTVTYKHAPSNNSGNSSNGSGGSSGAPSGGGKSNKRTSYSALN